MNAWQKSLRQFRTDAQGPGQVLGELEAAVMEASWRLDEINVTAVHQLLLKDRQIAYTTVQTTLERLAKKGLLVRKMRGRNYVYRPAVSRDDFMTGIAQQVLHALFGNLQDHQLASLVDALDGVEGDTLDRLQRLIEERQRGSQE